jgi:hypothetical protein
MPRVQLGATVLRVPAADELPNLIARIARLWAELHEANPALALTVARALPAMKIKRNDPR